jgi:4-amino-4-deoxy-L-arabinose transferase-like glycosyltransferase
LDTFSKIAKQSKAIVSTDLPFLVLLCFFFSLFVVWLSLDKTVPLWDSAAHLTDSYLIRDVLLEHIDPWNKIVTIFSITSWYPPFFNWVHCFFLLLPIPCPIADRIPSALFYLIGIVSTYKLGRTLFEDAAVGTVAAAIFCTIPVLYAFAHSPGLLDTPLASMCILALWLIARWNSKPTVSNSLMMGLGIALAGLTKQTGAIYLAPAVSIIVFKTAFSRDRSKLIQLACGLALGIAIYFAWFLPNLIGILKNLGSFQSSFSYRGGGFSLWVANLQFYFLDKLPKCISLPLAIVLVLSLFNLSAQRKLWIPASTIIALLIICVLRWETSTFQYALPIIGYVCLSSAALLVALWRSGRLLLKLFDLAVGLYLLALYLVLNFTPYPLPRNPNAPLLGIYYVALGCICPGTFPASPWPEDKPPGYDWLINQLASANASMLQSDKQSTQDSQVSPASSAQHLTHRPTILLGTQFEFGSIRYLFCQRGVHVRWRRLVQIRGNEVGCCPVDLGSAPKFFLARKDAGPFPKTPQFFRSEEDRDRFNKLTTYFEKTKKFVKVGECVVYDGDLFPPNRCTLILYRYIDTE